MLLIAGDKSRKQQRLIREAVSQTMNTSNRQQNTSYTNSGRHDQTPVDTLYLFRIGDIVAHVEPDSGATVNAMDESVQNPQAHIERDRRTTL